MGSKDMDRQALNVFRMRLLGAEVVRVDAGSRTLKDAINEAMRDWVTHVDDTYYLLGSVLGPHPYPLMVREFQSVIGREARAQILEQAGRLPDAVLACVGGGSNAMGIFDAFIGDAAVRLIGVEAGGESITRGRHAARFAGGSAGVLQGTRTFVLQDDNGNIELTHSVSAGLDYAAIGPEHAFLRSTGRAEYSHVGDAGGPHGVSDARAPRGHSAGARVVARDRLRGDGGQTTRRGEDSAGQSVGPRRQGRQHGGEATCGSLRPSRASGRKAGPASSRTRRRAIPISRGRRRSCRRSIAPARTSSRSACRFRIRWPTARSSSGRPSGRLPPAAI